MSSQTLSSQTLSSQTLPPSLAQIVDRILSSRQITRADQHQLFAVRSLTLQEQTLINRVFDRLRLGLLKVVD